MRGSESPFLSLLSGGGLLSEGSYCASTSTPSSSLAEVTRHALRSIGPRLLSSPDLY